MAKKIFASRGSIKLISDERDIAIDWRKRQEVWDWSAEHGIDIEFQSTRFGTPFGLDIWRVKNEQHRALFLLKWGG